jgi:GAF domain-containing protein
MQRLSNVQIRNEPRGRARHTGDALSARSPAALAMATAARVFAQPAPAGRLIGRAARVVAHDLGCVCVISVVGGTDHSLRLACVAHPRPRAVHALRRALRHAHTPSSGLVDAFSRTVQSTRRSLRMPIGEARVLRLWLPEPYWAYVEHHGVRDVLAVPLITAAEHMLGALVVWRERGQAAFSDDDLAYLEALAGRLALGIAAPTRYVNLSAGAARSGSATTVRRRASKR